MNQLQQQTYIQTTNHDNANHAIKQYNIHAQEELIFHNILEQPIVTNLSQFHNRHSPSNNQEDRPNSLFNHFNNNDDRDSKQPFKDDQNKNVLFNTFKINDQTNNNQQYSTNNNLPVKQITLKLDPKFLKNNHVKTSDPSIKTMSSKGYQTEQQQQQIFSSKPSYNIQTSKKKETTPIDLEKNNYKASSINKDRIDSIQSQNRLFQNQYSNSQISSVMKNIIQESSQKVNSQVSCKQDYQKNESNENQSNSHLSHQQYFSNKIQSPKFNLIKTKQLEKEKENDNEKQKQKQKAKDKVNDKVNDKELKMNYCSVTKEIERQNSKGSIQQSFKARTESVNHNQYSHLKQKGNGNSWYSLSLLDRNEQFLNKKQQNVDNLKQSQIQEKRSQCTFKPTLYQSVQKQQQDENQKKNSLGVNYLQLFHMKKEQKGINLIQQIMGYS